jgi:hypothetical protein
LLVLRSREYLYLNQFGQGTIKRIDFYGNVSASATHMPLNCNDVPHARRASQSLGNLEMVIPALTLMRRAQAAPPPSVSLATLL